MDCDKDSLIKALRAACKMRGIAICHLIKCGVEKNEEITALKERISFLEKWARWNKEMNACLFKEKNN